MASRKSAKTWVREQSERMRKHVLARKLATPEQVKEVWPPNRADLVTWIRAYGSLRAWVWQQDTAPASRLEAEERLLAALNEEPVNVRLTDGSIVCVYPKGLDALLWFRAHDWMVGFVGDRLEALREAAEDGALDRELTPDPSALLEAGADELTTQVAMMAAAACQPGPSIDRAAAEDPPARFRDLSVWDFHLINRAFWDVNAGALEELKTVVGPSKTGKRIGWSVFVGSLSMKLKVSPEELSRNRSLVSLLAQVRLAQPDLEEELSGDG